MTTINRHPATWDLIREADLAFNRGEVELPIDYINQHFKQYPDSEKLYLDIQDIYESRVYQ